MVRRAPDTQPSFTVAADVLRGLIECAVICGLPRERFRDILRKDGDATSPARYAGERILRLWDRVNSLSGDPIIGFRMARGASLKTFGVLGQITPRCATLFDAFKQTERYLALVSQGAHMRVDVDASGLKLSLDVDVAHGAVRTSILLWGLTNLVLTPMRLTGVLQRPKEVSFPFPSPGVGAERALKELFPVRFKARQCRVIYPRSVGRIALPSADAEMRQLLSESMDRRLTDLGSTRNFEDNLMTLLRATMDGTIPTLASLSKNAGMSQRTLQRRLREGRTSFQSLLQRVLHAEADSLLSSGERTQGEVAFLLGYSEVSAFSRAYRGWTGHPPGGVHA